MDMEMVQFHPTGMVWPPNMVGTLVTEAVRGEGGILLNNNNERFMKRYDPERMELSARDIVSRAIDSEIIEGRGTAHNGVWLSISLEDPEYIKKRLPKMYAQFKATGIDITKEKMEVAPTAHYTMGGVKTDYSGQTKIKGLFAVGEVSCDVHGANRLGGNSLAETIVFGKIIGKEIVKFCRNNKSDEITEKEVGKLINEIDAIFLKGKGKFSPQDIKKETQETMWKYVGIVRERKTLEEAVRKLKFLKKKLADLEIKNISDFVDAMDARSVILLSELVSRSALNRRESRGAHFREDFPKQSKWPKHIICKKEKGKIKFYFKNVPKIRGVLEKMLKNKIKTEHHLLE